MTISQRSLLLGLSLALAACGGEGLTLPPDGAAANIEVMSGNGQSGRVGSTLAEPLVVRVTDTQDRPVAGATVVFAFTDASGGGAASPASVTTDNNGLASSSLTLGSRVGPVTGTAEVPVDAGSTPVEASFSATALPENANGVALVSGNDQGGPVNTALPAPLVVQVSDGFGNPISGVTINWSVTGGGSVSEATTQTGSNGQTSVTRTLGPTAGQQTTLASADGLAGSPVTFTHTATAGTATGVVKVSGDGQSALAGTELADPLVVQVLDAQQNPIPGRAVTWVPGTGDGTVNPENSTTDAQGLASTRWTLGPAAGPNTVNAVVSGVGTAPFTATGTAGTPSASNSTVSALPTTINAGTGSSTITVTVRDAGNNPVSGASVTPASSGSENTISPASAATGTNGVATFTFSSTVAGSKTITATAGGVAITDQATVTVQKVSSTTQITSDPDAVSVGETITVQFTVSGSGGTPTGDVTVTVSGGPETCTATLASGSGSCPITFLLPGSGADSRRVVTATYAGDARFAGSSDTDNQRVDPAPNLAPVTQNDTYQGAEDTPLIVSADNGVLANDQDPEGGTLTATDASNPANGSVTLNANGSFTYTPDLNFSGNDQFTYRARDPAGSSTTGTVTIQVAPVNDQPVANDDGPYATPGGGAALTILAPGVLANDSDPDDALSAQNASDPALGSVSLNSDGSFTYTPDLDASGNDTFTYQATDGSLTSTATVTVTITP